MGYFSAETQWEKAKKDFEAVAGKKRPGMNVSKLAKFIKSYKAHTGLTPICKQLDKAVANADLNWGSVDLDKKAQMLKAIEEGEAALKDKGKAYLAIVGKSIEAELDDGDGRGDLLRALNNLNDTVQVMLKSAKVVRMQRQVQYDGLKSGKKAGDAIKDSFLLAAPAVLSKCVAGMKVIVRNVKAKPTLDVWMKEMGKDPATRWTTTKLKDLGNAFKKYPALQDKVGADPFEFEKKLNIYGGEWDQAWWTKKLGDPSKHKDEILKHVKVIESQIPNIEILHDRLKEALKTTPL